MVPAPSRRRSTAGTVHHEDRAKAVDGGMTTLVRSNADLTVDRKLLIRAQKNVFDRSAAYQRVQLAHALQHCLRFIGEAPVLKISALTGKGVHKLLPALSLSIEDYHRRVPTRRVNEVIRAAQQAQPGPHGLRVLYATQVAVLQYQASQGLEPDGLIGRLTWIALMTGAGLPGFDENGDGVIFPDELGE